MTCPHRPTGVVTSDPTGYHGQLNYASTVVCDQQKCVRKAQRWVVKQTDERPSLVRWTVRTEA